MRLESVLEGLPPGDPPKFGQRVWAVGRGLSSASWGLCAGWLERPNGPASGFLRSRRPYTQ